jgi:hypothetical protein
MYTKQASRAAEWVHAGVKADESPKNMHKHLIARAAARVWEDDEACRAVVE